MRKGAVIYISSNREKPEFEKAIVDDMLLKKGALPVFSVTQKPMEFENNIVVGDVGTSGFNFCRQLQMVVESADVDYVYSCEADCLYSPDYFHFIPLDLNAVYRNTNNYVIPYKSEVFYKKESQTAFQIAGRDFLLKRLNYLLKDQPQWNIEMKNFPKEINELFLEEWETFSTQYGCFGIKTEEGMRRQTRHGKGGIMKLPYWGTVINVKEKYYGQN